MSRVLVLDAAGQPDRFVPARDAILAHAKNQVVWQLGEGSHDVMFRGGQNRMTGAESRIVTAPIIAIKNESGKFKRAATKPPALTNSALFARDRHLCAYCGRLFGDKSLSRDHILPTSRGGLDVWTNVVTACSNCNHRKDDQLLSECGMELLYVPYAPNWAEHLILEERNVLACQMDYLLSFIPDHSRIWDIVKERAN